MIDIEYVKANMREGWQVYQEIINRGLYSFPAKKPDAVVNGIIRGLNRCDGNCPCDNKSEDPKCPCSGYRFEDKCCCNLYVKVQ